MAYQTPVEVTALTDEFALSQERSWRTPHFSMEMNREQGPQESTRMGLNRIFREQSGERISNANTPADNDIGQVPDH